MDIINYILIIFGSLFLAMSSPLKFKPFNCEKCLAFWLTLGYSIYHKVPLDISFIRAAAAGCGAMLLFQAWMKLARFTNK